MKKVLENAKDNMEKSIDALESEFASIRVGRANPAVLDKVKVNYYGTPTAINQLASVAVTEARILTIQPWDISVCKDIERAIQASDIGINPQCDGKIIRITFPPLTEERRRDLAKEISKMSEERKITIRSVRRESIEKIKAMKKNDGLSEDDAKSVEKKIQDLTNEFCKQVDSVLEKKQKEIMEI